MATKIRSLRFLATILMCLSIAYFFTTTSAVMGQTSDVSCTDSDGGRTYDISGIVSGIGPRGYPFAKYDACETGDYEGYVKEFYCNGTTPLPVRFRCDNGCADGACLPDITCTDNDGDGFAIEGGACGVVDCNDEDANVNPGANEICDNGIDDDCNGLTDTEDLELCPICTDNDGDGFAIEGGICGAVDCNDDDENVNPGATEICGNGIDDNCNGLVDDDDPVCGDFNVIVVGWDGTQRDHFWECYNSELDQCPDGLPNIAALSGGTIFNSVITSGETSTKPGWSQILTGYRAEVTGVLSNGDYQPIPEGYSLFEKVTDFYGPDNLVTMFVSGKSVHTGGACVGDETTHNGLPVIEDQGQPWCLTKTLLDYYENDLRQNYVVGNRAMELLELHQNDRFLAFFLFREPDVTGHVAGENSIYYTQKIVDSDYWLGQIMLKLQDLEIADRTLIYVTTDHGFDEGTDVHHNARYGFIATNDPLVIRSGDRMDLAPTILERYGITQDAIGNAPAVDGSSLYAIPSIPCVSEGNPFIDYPGAPMCCSGLERISFDYMVGTCQIATGGTGDNSGYCTNCGNGICESPENPCNCPVDCSR